MVTLQERKQTGSRVFECDFLHFFSLFFRFSFYFYITEFINLFSSKPLEWGVWGFGWGVVLWSNWGSRVGNGLGFFSQLGQSGDGPGDLSWDWGWGWKMGTRWVVTELVSVPFEGDGDSFWGGVGRGSLGSLGFTLLATNVLQLTSFLHLDTVSGFVPEI